MDKYYPEGDKASSFTAYGYTVAQSLVEVLKQCGDDLTRANVMKQAASLKSLSHPMLLPGITINTSDNGLRADQADADAEVQRRALGAVRPDHERRRGELSAKLYLFLSRRVGEGAVTSAGASGRRRFFFIITFHTCHAISPAQTTSRVTAIGRV